MKSIVGNNSRVLKLVNVLLVPDLKNNLVSVSQMSKQGNIVPFDHRKCTISNPTGLVALANIAPNRLYNLDVITEANGFLASVESSY